MSLPALIVVPRVDVAPHTVAFPTITLLELAFQLIALPVDRGEIIVSELAPLFLDLAFDLLPIAFDSVPIHFGLLFLYYKTSGSLPSSENRRRVIDPRAAVPWSCARLK